MRRAASFWRIDIRHFIVTCPAMQYWSRFLIVTTLLALIVQGASPLARAGGVIMTICTPDGIVSVAVNEDGTQTPHEHCPECVVSFADIFSDSYGIDVRHFSIRPIERCLFVAQAVILPDPRRARAPPPHIT